jgi:hypothetical protein
MFISRLPALRRNAVGFRYGFALSRMQFMRSSTDLGAAVVLWHRAYPVWRNARSAPAATTCYGARLAVFWAGWLQHHWPVWLLVGFNGLDHGTVLVGAIWLR